ALLALNGPGRAGTIRTASAALLQGLLFCRPCGCAMTPAQVTGGHRRYRYYTCSGAQRKGWRTCPSKSLPAAVVERYVLEQIASSASEGRAGLPPSLTAPSSDPRQRIRDRVRRIDYDGTNNHVVIPLKPPSSKESA